MKVPATYCCGVTPCENENGKPQWILPDQTTTAICPLRLVRDADREWLRWHALYLRGVLPVAGGMLDQSGHFYDAMLILDEVM